MESLGWILFCIVVIFAGALLIWAFNIPESDNSIIQSQAQKYGIKQRSFNNIDDIINQLLTTTLAQNVDVPTDAYFEIVTLPKEFIIANIYTVSEISNTMIEEQVPIIFNNPFEIYLNAVGMAQARGIPYFYLFSLYSFGVKAFLAASHLPIANPVTSVSLYPWTSLQYSELVSLIGPAQKHAYFNINNFL